MGLDIGMDNVGICVLHVDGATISPVALDTIQSNPDAFIEPVHTAISDLKIRYMVDTVVNYVTLHQVDTVVIEQPFFNQSHVHAVLRLYRLFWGIIDALKVKYPTLTVRAITAPKARSYIGYKRMLGTSTKLAVLAAAQTIPAFQCLDLTDYSEHAIDALVVTAAYVASNLHLSLINGELSCLKS